MMSREFPPAMRKKMIGKVHIAKNQLAIDDDVYRDLLEDVTGKRSCKDMDERELHLVLERMRGFGFKNFFPATKDNATKTQVDKIRALWIDLAKSELVPDGESVLLGFVKRQTKVDRLEWLTPKQCNAVIEGLKAIQDRSEAESAVLGFPRVEHLSKTSVQAIESAVVEAKQLQN